MLGRHCMKHWSSTQASVALSSGEAEFAGVIRGSGQGLGYQALLRDFGIEAPLRVWTDSEAAIGICSRQGLGKLRHLDTHTLWIQQAVRSGRIDLRKVLGDRNPADLLTKHSLSRARLEMLVGVFGCQFIEGRSDAAPLLRRGDAPKQTIADADLALDSVSLGTSMVAAANPSGKAPPTMETSMVAPASHSATASPTTNGDDDPGTPVIMPHVSLSETDIDIQHPRLEAPEEVLSADPTDDARDTVFQHGLRIAEQIQQDAVNHGRLRHTEEAGTKARATATTASPTLPPSATTSSRPSLERSHFSKTSATTTPPALAGRSSGNACNFVNTSALRTGRPSAGGVFSCSTFRCSQQQYFSNADILANRCSFALCT